MSKKETYCNLLQNVATSELKSLRVAIKRHNFTTTSAPGPLERSIDDPRNIIPCVHYGKGYANPIFDREDILANKEKRNVIADANVLEADEDEKSQSGSRRRSRSYSPNYRGGPPHRTCERSPVQKSSRDRIRSRDREGTNEWHRRSRSRSIERSKRYDHRRKSRSPIHVRERLPSPRESQSGDRRRSRSRDTDYKKYRSRIRRSRSHSREYRPSRKSISPTIRRKSRSPRRRTPSVDRSRTQRAAEYKGRPSRSPGTVESKRYSDRHRSRSRSHSRNDREKRRSRSPRRRSRSRRRSPRPSSSRPFSTHRRSPPSNEKDRKRRKSRTRSRSPRREIPPIGDYHAYFEAMPGAEYWIPNQMRPRLPIAGIPRFFPPTQPFYPRDMNTYFLQPRLPPGFVPFRHKLPIYNSRSFTKTQIHTKDQPSITETTVAGEKDSDDSKKSESQDPRKDASDTSENT